MRLIAESIPELDFSLCLPVVLRESELGIRLCSQQLPHD